MDDPQARLAGGDPAAFAEIYERFAPALHPYLAAMLGSRDEADDALHEVFLRLVRSRRRLARVESLQSYLFRMARNEAFRLTRRLARARRLRIAAAEERAAASSSAGDRQVGEIREWLDKSLARLSAEQREVVVLHIYGGLTFREIAEVLAAPPGTVASRYRAAIESLRKSLLPEFS